MKVKIKNLTFNCIIGILDFERKKKQKVIIDCSFKYDYKKDEFIDYSEVANLLEKTMKKKKFLLIEEAIIHLKQKLLKKYKINDLKISIKKPTILKNCIVSVQE